MSKPETAPKPKSRNIQTATNHLVKQREKAIAIRDKAEAEIKGLDAALLALGWPEK